MLLFDLRAVQARPVETTAIIAAGDPLFDGLGFRLRQPVEVGGRLTESGPSRYYWHGKLTTSIAATCRRCLVPVAVEVAPDVRALFTEDDTGDDPSTYVIRPGATELDLGDTVREELILAAPEYVVCREDCRGLCPRCGSDLNEGDCACQPEPDPRWAALDAVKARWSDDTR